MTKWDLLDSMKIPYFNKDLINNAFIHSSYVNEAEELLEDNERLEFMGDAVLQICVSERLFKHQDHFNEGDMTLYRAKLVCEDALAQYSLKLRLNDYLMLGMGEEKNGGRVRVSIIADLFESFIGALYLDSGIDSVNRVLDSVMNDAFNELESLSITDYKTKLQEYIQSDSRKSVSYEVINVVGPSNAPEFEVVVKLDELIFGQGKGLSKKKAEQMAAKDAFEKLVK
ncbi:ribonuclease III [Erysipelothrix rhusiopathiae]|uniref:ribonuclease III n=1 Tax=Erysipelothrix rhusiopathiae TaxID=1648 RepID=UPI000F42DE5C|nr:ribonuclease III [Erysipelothrix rhusiopathiae]AYV34582.1 ribonuclease III [Erysipelothrix rhusiopathiae]MDE8081189.1 ribonuclease III [Erysipelothrix rhusiopathiae]MDE8268433.1 ribonuclease III [Erysipelothrix rhusiopathiae]MDE8314391.1 ribonuclease III [Erysipelothrix rhusiopathiae]MDE8329401.1 ribonuclease III [Erysipelothrix rhusiopathiae]